MERLQGEGFCREERCDYYRKSGNIFSELEESDRERVDEHFLIRHIML